ncbi:hypothetical protein CVT24_002595 [Panaeolus cyanescens]|uniref:Uncharacterized protein n=1 Tax=Panaeolus cyanescens TaxID=181874 RepID=A0A409WB18_9AGAR|nr:hypothetical protein CVT24_002595 [Panaeolus cyanescens]
MSSASLQLAIGGFLAFVILAVPQIVVIRMIISRFQRHSPLWLLVVIICSLPFGTLGGTLSGVMGCAILRSRWVDLGGLDVLHAARAGALGGSIVFFIVGLVFDIIQVYINVESRRRRGIVDGVEL